MDIYVESRLLLEKLANSVFERQPIGSRTVFFSRVESHIVEDWMQKTREQIKKEVMENQE